ncbi:hypothetical protein, partial [Zooshikella harenae]
SLLSQHFSKDVKDKIKFLKKPVTVAAYRLMLNKINPKHVQLIESFNVELKALKRTKRVEEIYQPIFKDTPIPANID